ncbi:MAG: sortase [Caldilineaceae bacterium]|nr:sortase [Caldilineaceae bacterium]
MNRPLLVLLILIMILPAGCSRAGSDAVAQARSNEAVTGQQPAPPQQSNRLQHPAGQGLLPERLVIPAIHLDIPVVELGWRKNTAESGAIFSEWEVAEYAAGWHKNSALLGDSSINGGNLVMSGHNNILGSVFRELDQLKRNDEITVWSGDQSFAYRIDKVVIVPEKYATEEQRRANAAWIGSFNEERLTLVSCWPRDDNTHRIIVVAHPQP